MRIRKTEKVVTEYVLDEEGNITQVEDPISILSFQTQEQYSEEGTVWRSFNANERHIMNLIIKANPNITETFYKRALTLQREIKTLKEEIQRNHERSYEESDARQFGYIAGGK